MDQIISKLFLTCCEWGNLRFSEELVQRIQANDPAVTAITISESDFSNDNLVKLAITGSVNDSAPDLSM